MNELTPIEQRQDLQMIESMEDYGAPHPHSAFPVRRLLIALLKYWWIPVLTLVIGLCAGVAYVRWMPPTFVSKASMWETVKVRLPEGSLFTDDSQDFLGTQTELLQSDKLRELALARLKAANTNAVIPLGNDHQPLPVVITVSGTKSSVFVIQAKSADPAYTQAYLNALMEVYLEYNRNIRQEISGDTLASITEQVQVTERELNEQQDALMVFQRTNNMAILEQEGAIAGNYLATLKTKLSDLQLEAHLLKATTLDQSSTNAGATNDLGNSIAPSGLAVTSPTMSDSSADGSAPPPGQTSFNELENLKIQRAQLSQYLRPKHPKIVKLDADIERAEKLLDIYRRENQEQLIQSQRNIQLKMENIQSSISEWEGKVIEANTLIGEAERLKMNVQRVQSVYDRLTLLLQNVGLSRNIDQENLAVLEQASPAKRSYIKESSTLTMSSVGGLGLGLGILLLIGFRDDRFTSLNELREKLGEVVVGQVPEIRDLQADATVPLLEKNDQRHVYAESFRSLRSALFFMAAEPHRPRVVLITSAIPNEGKSTVAANLARSLAMGGSRVVLIDGDLRKGALHKLMGLQSDPGFAEALRQPGDLEKLIQTNSHANLSFISRGTMAANSGDLFLAPAFDQVIAVLRQRFDYVLIDSSPVFATDDASTLAPKVDGTLFVVRSGYSSPKPVREALGLLYQRRARVLGVIFNQADPSDRSYYYYKNAEYYQVSNEA